MEIDNKENIVEEEEKFVGFNELYDLVDDEMDFNRSVKFSNYSLIVEVIEKYFLGLSLKVRIFIGIKDGFENIKKVLSLSVENIEVLNNRFVKNRKTIRRLLNFVFKMFDDIKELVVEVEEMEENLEVFEEEFFSTLKRKFRRFIRFRLDFVEILESFVFGDKENAKLFRLIRRLVVVVDGFKLLLESLFVKRLKLK